MTCDQKFEQIKRKLAAALKELEEPPDALLFLEWEEMEWDYDLSETICGLPIYFHKSLRHIVGLGNSSSVPFAPIWSDYKKSPELEYIENFNDTYEMTE